MKTWEMIKALDENPDLKFKTTVRRLTYVGKRDVELVVGIEGFTKDITEIDDWKPLGLSDEIMCADWDYV